MFLLTQNDANKARFREQRNELQFLVKNNKNNKNNNNNNKVQTKTAAPLQHILPLCLYKGVETKSAAPSLFFDLPPKNNQPTSTFTSSGSACIVVVAVVGVVVVVVVVGGQLSLCKAST